MASQNVYVYDVLASQYDHDLNVYNLSQFPDTTNLLIFKMALNLPLSPIFLENKIKNNKQILGRTPAPLKDMNK